MEARTALAGLALAAVASFAAAPALARGPESSLLRRTTNVRAAIEDATRDGKPLVLVFGAAWCPPCERLERELSERPSLERFRDSVAWARVDVDRNPSMAAAFGIDVVPDVVVLGPGDAAPTRIGGLADASVLESRLGELLGEAPPEGAVAPAPVVSNDDVGVRRPDGYRSMAACFSHVGYGPLELGSQSPFRAVRMGIRPRPPSTLGRGQYEVRGVSTWTNVWAVGDGYLLDYETLQLSTTVSYGISDRLEIEGEFQDTSRFGGALDGLTQGFHDLFGIDQNGRDEVPRNAFAFELEPPGGGPAVRLSPSDRGSFARSAQVSLRHNISCGTARWPAVSYSVSARVDAGESTDLAEGSGSDLGASVALARRFGRVYVYGTLGYAWFGRDSFRGLPLEGSQYTMLAAAEWAVASRHSLLVQYLLTDGVVSDFDPFSEPSHEVTLGWKWEFRPKGLLEVGIIENVLSFDNGPDVGLHVGVTRRF